MSDWLDAPTVSGLYWAYNEKRAKNDRASICKVNILSPGRWSATFISGTQTYTFQVGQGWLWQPANPPESPHKRVAA